MALLTMVQLMHSSLWRSSVVEERLQGALCAQQKLEEIRAWATEPANFYSDWSTYDNVVVAAPNYPSIQTTTTISDQPISSPSRLLETAYPPAEQRTLENVCQGVTVECRWGEGPQNRVELSSLVSAPPGSFRADDPLEITPGPATLARDSAMSFQVTAFDSAGREIQGLTYSWFIVPGPGPPDLSRPAGTGTLVQQSRDGRTAEIGNWLLALDGVTRVYAPGFCQFAVRARYNGQETLSSVEVEML